MFIFVLLFVVLYSIVCALWAGFSVKMARHLFGSQRVDVPVAIQSFVINFVLCPITLAISIFYFDKNLTLKKEYKGVDKSNS